MNDKNKKGAGLLHIPMTLQQASMVAAQLRNTEATREGMGEHGKALIFGEVVCAIETAQKREFRAQPGVHGKEKK